MYLTFLDIMTKCFGTPLSMVSASALSLPCCAVPCFIMLCNAVLCLQLRRFIRDAVQGGEYGSTISLE
jgi:hypothetical protein